VATSERKSRWEEGRQEHDLGTCLSGGHQKVSLSHAVAGVLVALLFLETPGAVFAQEEGSAPPLPAPGAPPTAPPQSEQQEPAPPFSVPGAPSTSLPQGQEDEAATPQEQRTVRRPFFLPEVTPTERLIPDATSDLNSSVLIPPNAFEGLRPREKLIQVGDFVVSPRIAVAETYDDNTNASKSDRKDDITTNLQGSVRVDSLFKRHSLGFEVSAAIDEVDKSFGSNTTDRITVASGIDGRLDLTQHSTLSAEAQLTRGAQDPEAQEAGAEEEPRIFTAAGAIAFAQQFERLGWQVAAGANRVEADGGDEASEQDRISYTIFPSVDYQVSRRLSAFAEAGYARNEYDHDGEGGSRNSQSIQATVGADLGLGRSFGARVGIGYIGVFFDDSERGDQQSPAFTLDLDGAINLDRLTLLSVALNHETDLTTADSAALVTRTTFSTSISRLLTPASAIVARVNLSRSDFVDENRTDHDVIAELAYSHTLFRNIALDVSYRFSKRFSDRKEREFYRNIASIGLSASF
jgi:hypothetical protein